MLITDCLYKDCKLDLVLIGLDQNNEGERLAHHPDAVRRVIAEAIASKPCSLTGSEIHFLRAYLGVSRTWLGKSFGVSREDIRSIEQGESFATPDQEAGLRRSLFTTLKHDQPETSALRTWATTRGEENTVYRIDASNPPNYRLYLEN